MLLQLNIFGKYLCAYEFLNDINSLKDDLRGIQRFKYIYIYIYIHISKMVITKLFNLRDYERTITSCCH